MLLCVQQLSRLDTLLSRMLSFFSFLQSFPRPIIKKSRFFRENQKFQLRLNKILMKNVSKRFFEYVEWRKCNRPETTDNWAKRKERKLSSICNLPERRRALHICENLWITQPFCKFLSYWPFVLTFLIFDNCCYIYVYGMLIFTPKILILPLEKSC